MSRFYGSMKGSRGEATRCGDITHGLNAHIRGYNVGAQVVLSVNDAGEDECAIYLTSGSNARHVSRLLGTFTAKDASAPYDELKAKVAGTPSFIAVTVEREPVWLTCCGVKEGEAHKLWCSTLAEEKE